MLSLLSRFIVVCCLVNSLKSEETNVISVFSGINIGVKFCITIIKATQRTDGIMDSNFEYFVKFKITNGSLEDSYIMTDKNLAEYCLPEGNICDIGQEYTISFEIWDWDDWGDDDQLTNTKLVVRKCEMVLEPIERTEEVLCKAEGKNCSKIKYMYSLTMRPTWSFAMD